MGSFRRGIRIFRSQEVKIESRPSLSRKNVKIKIYVLIICSHILFFLLVHRVKNGSGGAGQMDQMVKPLSLAAARPVPPPQVWFPARSREVQPRAPAG